MRWKRYGELHLSTDDDAAGELVLAAAVNLSTSLARKYTQGADRAFAMFDAGPGVPPGEMLPILWGACLSYFVGHMSRVIGEDATAAVLQEVVDAQQGDPYGHH